MIDAPKTNCLRFAAVANRMARRLNCGYEFSYRNSRPSLAMPPSCCWRRRDIGHATIHAKKKMPTTAITIAALGLTLVVSNSLPAQSCRGADSTSTFMLNATRNLVSSTLPQLIRERQSLHLPAVSPETVVLVADTMRCSQMATAYAGVLAASSGKPSGRVYVLQVGTVYVVRDPAIVAGEFAVEMVIDDQGHVLARYTS
jgi:hypothetical protein